MRFRSKHIADSVTERITAIAKSLRTGADLPPPRGAAVVALNRQPNGDLAVTKTFENGETELLTISNSNAGAQLPDGFVDVTPGQTQGAEQQSLTGIDGSGIVESAALGGDSLDALIGA